jgi:hypothetical protein
MTGSLAIIIKTIEPTEKCRLIWINPGPDHFGSPSPTSRQGLESNACYVALLTAIVLMAATSEISGNAKDKCVFIIVPSNLLRLEKL